MALSRRHPAVLATVIGVALGTMGIAYAAVDSSTKPKTTLVSQTQVEEGKALFIEGCSSCHGLAGQGTSDGPSLIGVGAASVDFQVSTGRMPGVGPGIQAPKKKAIYNETEIAALAAYVATLGPGPAIPTAELLDTSGADLALGGELFRTNCAQCHGVSGRGGALSEGGVAPSLMDSDAKNIYQAMISGPQNMPVFSDTTLPVEDKQAIIAYIEQLQKGENPGGNGLGRLGPVTEGLFIWVVGLGALLAVAIWIGAKAK